MCVIFGKHGWKYTSLWHMKSVLVVLVGFVGRPVLLLEKLVSKEKPRLISVYVSDNTVN